MASTTAAKSPAPASSTPPVLVSLLPQEIKSDETPEISVLPGSRCNVIVPSRYEVWGSGVYKRKALAVQGAPKPNIRTAPATAYVLENLETVVDRPVYVSGIGFREDDENHMVALTFLASAAEQRDVWKTIWVPNNIVSSATEIVKLSNLMVPVTSVNAKAFVEFVYSSVNENFRLIPRTQLVLRQGWHQLGDDEYGWLLGTRWIGKGLVSPDTTQQTKTAKGFRRKGTFEEWKLQLNQWCSDDKNGMIFRWSTAVAFAAPLLRFINLRTFIHHHFAQARTAKTTLAYLAQTVWGHYKETAKSFNSSQIGSTEAFSEISDLPLLFDELQVNSLKSLSKFIYAVCQEEGRLRAKPDGLGNAARCQTWHTVARTTGEMPIVGADDTDLGGQAGRVLEIRHPGLPEAVGKEVWNWLRTAGSFGHAGPEFLAKLLDADKSKILALYQKYQATLSAEVNGSGGYIDNTAAICLAEFLMLTWIFGWSAEEAHRVALGDAKEIVTCWLRSQQVTPLWMQAMELLIEHRHTQPQTYADPSTEEGRLRVKQFGTKGPHGVMALVNVGRNRDEIWYFPTQLDKLLKNQFQAGPDRIVGDLVDNQIFTRAPDHLRQFRQLTGVLTRARMYVGLQEAIFRTDVEPGARPSLGIDLSGLMEVAL